MELETKNIYEQNWSEFFTAVEEYNSVRILSGQMSDLIANGLKVFLRFPNSKYTSLYLFNQENLEFEHKSTMPFNALDISKDTFNFLLDNAAFSETLQTGSATFFPQDIGLHQPYFLILPMISFSGLNGLIIVALGQFPIEIESYHLRICTLHASLIANTIENTKLTKDFKQMQSLLDQKVALKTMSLYQSKRELQTILDAVQIGILVVDFTTSRLISANYIAGKLTGYSTTELEGMDVDIVFLDESSLLKRNIGESFKISRSFESELLTKDGKIKPILRTATKVNFGERKVRIDSFVDITDRKNYEVALRDANELLELKVLERTEDLQILVHKLQNEISDRIKAQNDLVAMFNKEKELHEMKTKFISMVSHEFRTPLTVIKTSSEILKNHLEKLGGNERDNYLSRISSTVDKMTILLDDVLQIGKYDETKQLNTIIINLPDLCEEMIHDIRMNIGTNRSINFSKNKDNHYIYADERLLRLIISNVVSNSIKYSEPDSPVLFELICDQDFSTFIIEDKGIGIPEKDLNRIFESFHRGSNVGSISGTGLGLSIVHKAIRDHGGKIEITSDENKGTKVLIRIPFVINKQS
jgi:PAS domain S-box-containing protein